MIDGSHPPNVLPDAARDGLERAFLTILRARHPGTQVHARRDDDHATSKRSTAAPDLDVGQAAA